MFDRILLRHWDVSYLFKNSIPIVFCKKTNKQTKDFQEHPSIMTSGWKDYRGAVLQTKDSILNNFIKNFWTFEICFQNDLFPLRRCNRENCLLLNLVLQFIEIEAWLFLTFFLCLRNEIFSIYSIVTCWSVQMFEKCDSWNRQKWMFVSFIISARFRAKFGWILS